MSSHVENQSATRRTLSKSGRIGLFVAGIGALGISLTWMLRNQEPIASNLVLPWWVIAILFGAAEAAVLHIKFERDATSFSMSEVPLVLGLFFAHPVALVVGQAVGNVVILGLHRRQPLIKLAFNVCQFSVQSATAIVVFRSVAGSSAFGPRGWLAAYLAAATALVIADVLVNIVITLAGGRLTLGDMWSVFGITMGAAGANVTFALVGVLAVQSNPGAIVLAVAPPALLYATYRAYARQREEGARLDALYAVTRKLHEASQLEPALAGAVTWSREMFAAEYVELLAFPHGGTGPAYRTSAIVDGPTAAMVPVSPRVVASVRGLLDSADEGIFMGKHRQVLDGGRTLDVTDAMVSVLSGRHDVVGLIMVANRLGDVSPFTTEDQRLLDTVGAQVAVSIENGQLGDSLAEMTALKQRLEEIVRSRDEFVAAVSHELRTPLTAIVGLTAELRVNHEGLNGAEVQEFLDIIGDQGAELAYIVEDLLVAARAENGTLVLSSKETDLRAEVLAVHAAKARSGKARDEIEIRGACLAVSVDPLRLRQIIRNLMVNAGRYGGEHCWVELSSRHGMGSICVVDDGAGVPKGSEEEIFEPYRRAHNAVGDVASVGLGLAVSRGLARLMGGDLKYRRRGDHSVFEVTVPLADQETPAADPGAGLLATTAR